MTINVETMTVGQLLMSLTQATVTLNELDYQAKRDQYAREFGAMLDHYRRHIREGVIDSILRTQEEE